MTNHHLPKINQCLTALNVQELWDHEANQANSIGGILLHICEQVRRHTVRYQQGGSISTNGIEDYFPDVQMSPEELKHEVEEVFSIWRRAVEEFFLDVTKEVNMHSIYHLVEHASYHLGQIVDRVQRKTGKAFMFVQNGINERNLQAIIEHGV